ncbi:hypothetical protein CTAYLR_001647 [Chrysophaeum taylorii]|uniref:FYVE-type domain-containing protein n=1 Tax=Chrysophaeum taylorii TaxID=2483200 RepID=A0AAD7UDP9_9STRA|nr:hypothetical protein CTAYLR_001647 [Chrysophaeum taylorii]
MEYDPRSRAVWQSGGYDSVLSEAGLPKAPPVWVADAEASRCMAVRGNGDMCGRLFGSFEWRHHCRFCGKVVCGRCSSKNALLPGKWSPYCEPSYDFSEPRRVCDACFDALEPFQHKWANERAHAHQLNSVSNDAMTRYMNSPIAFSLGHEVRKATYALANLTAGVNYWDGDAEFVHRALSGAVGLLFVTMAKVAFIGGLRVGTGLLVARIGEGWSAPCAVGTFGLTFGAVVGAEISDTVTALDQAALDELCDESTSKISLGGAASLALGPLGRAAHAEAIVASDANAATTATYSHSRGFYGGVTLEGAYVSIRADVNHSFYGVPVTTRDLLRGNVQPPEAARPLYFQLAAYYDLAHDFIQSLPPASHTNSSPAFFLCGPVYEDQVDDDSTPAKAAAAAAAKAAAATSPRDNNNPFDDGNGAWTGGAHHDGAWPESKSSIDV